MYFLHDCNYLKDNCTVVDIDVLKERGEPFRWDPLYRWLMDNVSILRALPYEHECNTKTFYAKGRNGLPRLVDWEFERNLHYGYACLSYYIRWCAEELCWKLQIGDSSVYGEQAVRNLKQLVKDSLFVPVSLYYIGDCNAVFANSGCRSKNSYLGERILRTVEFMSDVDKLKSEGGRLNPKVYYFIDSRTNPVRFIRDTEKSPRRNTSGEGIRK